VIGNCRWGALKYGDPAKQYSPGPSAPAGASITNAVPAGKPALYQYGPNR
jgi:hypothetical protein